MGVMLDVDFIVLRFFCWSWKQIDQNDNLNAIFMITFPHTEDKSSKKTLLYVIEIDIIF